MRNQDDTTITSLDTMDTESFVQVNGSGNSGPTLSMTAAPRYDVIGVEAKDSKRSIIKSTEVCFTLQAGELPDNDDERAPVDIIVALDKSGSMGGGKLDLCKRSLETLLRQLLPSDRFSLITYSHEARVLVPLQRVTSAQKTKALKIIRELRAGGGTNMSAAVGLAATEISKISEPNPVQTVFFLTDGHANGGISDTPGLVNLVRNCFVERNISSPQVAPTSIDRTRGLFGSLAIRQNRAQVAAQAAAQASQATPTSITVDSRPAISLHTFGYGASHNSTLLREMASVTDGGSYFFIEEDKDVGKAFGDALGGVLSVVAQTATLTVDVPASAKTQGAEIIEVCHDQAIKREDGSFSVNVGDFYSEESRDVVLTVRLAEPSTLSTIPIPHVSAGLSYMSTTEKRLVTGEQVLVSIARPDGTNLSEENVHVASQSYRVFAAKEMEEAASLASAGRYREAKTKFKGTIDAYSMCSAAVQQSTQATELFQDATKMDQYMDNELEYKTKGHGYMSTKLKAHKVQRGAVCNNETYSATYGMNKKRTKFASKFS